MTMDQSSSLVEGVERHELGSDLAKLCLPQTFQDPNKKLAWANSVCFLFLVIGLIGLKPPKTIEKPISQPTDIVPVVFTPPEEQPKVEPQPQTEEPEPQRDSPQDVPQVATVVAADPKAAAFAVPVEGPVIFAPVAKASAPPTVAPKPAAPPKVTQFTRGEETGHFPEPSYPRQELLDHHEGKIMLYVIVNANGAVSSAEVKDSCGFPSLDRHVMNWVKRNWQWQPGQTRYFLVPFEFRIR